MRAPVTHIPVNRRHQSTTSLVPTVQSREKMRLNDSRRGQRTQNDPLTPGSEQSEEVQKARTHTSTHRLVKMNLLGLQLWGHLRILG